MYSIQETFSKKQDIPTIAEKNRIINRLIEALLSRQNFLIIGHQNPDEDCISSMVAMALLVSKLSRNAAICTAPDIPAHFEYLLDICKYNSIAVNTSCEDMDGGVDTVIICDTPKPSMLHTGPEVERLLQDGNVLKIEIDHHLETDSRYIGSAGYCLVAESSSASELVGLLACKLNQRRVMVDQYRIPDLLARNLVLAVLTGIIGDTQMGKYIKSHKEQRFYDMFSTMFNRLLVEKTTKRTNFFNMEQVFGELRRLSVREAECYRYLLKHTRSSPSVRYSVLGVRESERIHKNYDLDTVISVARGVADELAEASEKISLVAYYDAPEQSDFIQFRARRSHQYRKLDLRRILEHFKIENGGGHAGAIGFRIERDRIPDFEEFVRELIAGIESLVAEAE